MVGTNYNPFFGKGKTSSSSSPYKGDAKASFGKTTSGGFNGHQSSSGSGDDPFGYEAQDRHNAKHGFPPTKRHNVKYPGKFSKFAKTVGGGLKKGGKGLVKAGRASAKGIVAADKTQRAFKSEVYARRKLALERKENVIKHKANISGLRAQRAQSKADLLEARHKQYQVRQQAKLERQLNRSSGSNTAKYNPYGKSGGGFFSKGGPPKGV